MSLFVPTYKQYEQSVSQLQDSLSSIQSDINWAVYGSFINDKVRPWLSDIDVFVLATDENLIFPTGISRVVGDIKNTIESLRIPLQTSLVTTGMLGNSFTHPDINYLTEVKKWADSPYSSPWFNMDYSDPRDWMNDEASMSRYFLRKISDIWMYLPEIESIIEKNKEDISSNDQKKIWQLWDSFKKILTLLTTSIRITQKKSLFSESDQNIIETCKQEFNIWSNPDNHIRIMDNIKNINDWYNYLKEWGISDIEKIYADMFTPFINAIWNRLWEPMYKQID